ncbi:hypothetical protein F5880DRAFT_1183905 [Lentinula raphanica]|nr:hypothetical protein F5880DRAFT_1183905 [Lentinula raphanica]
MAIYVEDGFEQLQNMLTSCTHLTFLALHDCSLDSSITRAECTTLPLILPSSLEKACVTGTNERTFDALGLGMKSPQAPVLSSFLSDLRNQVEDRSQLWQGLGQRTSIVLDAGNMLCWPNSLTTSSWSRFDPLTSYIPAMISVTQGIVSSELTLHCSQQYQLVSYFAHFISVLPDPVRRIRIDFNARASDGPLDRDPDSWVKLDNALMKRHALGSLESICFRCTTRTISGHGPSYENGKLFDRKILDRIPALLNHSSKAGIVKIDHATLFF